MKSLLTLVFTVLFSTLCLAQNGINYKAIIKDANGNVVANDLVVVQFAILQSAAQTNVYQETHSPTTDANGLIILNIGEGTPISGTFNAINWASDTSFLNTKINTGAGLVDMGTTEFKTVPYAINAQTAANVTGLEKITEGSNTGWRLKGQDPNNYGNIGEDAVDLSYSDVASTTRGARGKNSIAMGFNTTAGYISTAMGHYTTASGLYSTAFGFSTTASEDSSTAMGYFTTASGAYSFATGSYTLASGRHSTAMGGSTVASEFYSTAMGLETEASGHSSIAMGGFTLASGGYSTAMGVGTTASGYISTAIGVGTTASGDNSTAMGEDTTASSYASLAIGRYNVGGGSATSWFDTDRLFEVGNGISSSAKSNALTILKNGKVGIGTSAPSSRFQITNGSDASYSSGSGYLVLGYTNGFNLVFDENEIMARTNGVASTLFLQQDGGDVRVGGVVVHSSDRRLKKDISALSYGLETVLQLNPVAYNWLNREQDHKSLGLIAQEVQPIISEIVHEDDDEAKTLSVSYTELIPVLIKAIKEQQEIILSQNKELKEQQELNNTQNSELTVLQQNYQSLISRIEVLESNISN